MSLVNWHIAFAFYSLGIVLLADKQAFSWLTGKVETLRYENLRRLHYLTWLGLGLLIVSGVTLLSSRPYLLNEPLFIIKLLFVAILFVNAFLIDRLMPLATLHSFRSLSRNEQVMLLLSGTLSMIGWVSVVSIAWYLFQ